MEDNDVAFRKRLQQTEQVVVRSEYYQRFLRALLQDPGIPRVKRIVAYGLGRVSEAVPAMHQAVFCSHLARHLQAACTAYDPIFTLPDWAFLRGALGIEAEAFPFDCQPPPPPREAATAVLVFMPHCDKAVNDVILGHLAQHTHVCFFLFCNTLTPAQLASVPLIEQVYGIGGGAYPRDDVFNNCSLYLLNHSLA